MSKAGKTVVRPSGKRGVLPGGKGAVYDADGHCTVCCEIDPVLLRAYRSEEATADKWWGKIEQDDDGAVCTLVNDPYYYANVGPPFNEVGWQTDSIPWEDTMYFKERLRVDETNKCVGGAHVVRKVGDYWLAELTFYIRDAEYETLLDPGEYLFIRGQWRRLVSSGIYGVYSDPVYEGDDRNQMEAYISGVRVDPIGTDPPEDPP